MKRCLELLFLVMTSVCVAVGPSEYDLPNKTIARADCCGVKHQGALPLGSLNQVFLQTITPSDLKCYEYIVNKPGTYIVTRDFQHVVELAKTGQPLIKVTSSNVTIDLQTFTLYQNGATTAITSNFIEIGDGVNPIENITIVNGTLSGAGGIGIVIKPQVSNVTLQNLSITHCIAGGIAMSGAKNILIEGCSITNHGNDSSVGNLMDNLSTPQYLDGTLFNLDSTSNIGAFGIVAKNCEQVSIKESEILSCGANNLDFESYGILAEGCSDIEVLRSVSSAHKSEDMVVKGMHFKDCKKGFVDCCLVTCNKGYGVVGIDVIDSDIFHISHTNVYENCSSGAWFDQTLPGGMCPGMALPLYTRCTPCDAYTQVMPAVNVDAVTAYADYKTGLVLPKTTTACIANWQTVDDDNNTTTPTALSSQWTTFMDAYHAIEYGIEYYTQLSRAFGIRLFDTNYVTIDAVSVIDTSALHNSAWGIMIDRAIDRTTCAANRPIGGKCNVIKFSKVQGTQSFSDVTAPNITYHTQIASLFGSGVLGAGPNYEVQTGESISMIGRAIGIEARNCVECTVMHNNLVKSNFSQYTFAAGIFLNRTAMSDLVANRIECNCGSDLGYGILNRTVDPTDMVAATVLYANGFSNATTTDKNINYGIFWAHGGVFTIKHAFTSDLTIMNNLGVFENVQIFFDEHAQPNLPCTIAVPDVNAAYQ